MLRPVHPRSRPARIAGAAALLVCTSLAVVPPGVAGGAAPAPRASTHDGAVVLDTTLPVTLTYSDLRPQRTVSGTVDFGGRFEVFSSVCLTATFGADGLDPGESFAWTFPAGGGVGQGNNGSTPMTSVSMCVLPYHEPDTTNLLDGSETFVLQVEGDEPDLGVAAVDLVAVSIVADGVTGPQDCSIVGTPGDDVLRGTSANDVICGLGGDDTLRGFGGDDVLVGGAGKDTLYGADGRDVLAGGVGGDVLFGGAGVDTLRGDAGWDRLFGGDDFDWILGGDDRDLASGGGGTDWIELGPGDAQVAYGDGGDDTIFGGAGTDRLYGGDGADALIGGAAHDQLYGGAGDDQLFGQAGGDWLCGQAGADLYPDVEPSDRVCPMDASGG